MGRIVYVNGAFVPEENAKISIFDRGFIFADGIYEVAAVLDGKLVDNAAHLARLEKSLGEIKMPLPLSKEEIQSLQKELVRRNGVQEGMVYLQVTRGAADREFAFVKDIPQTLVMFTQSFDIINSPKPVTGIKLASIKDIRWARRDIKSVALLAQVLAKQNAAEQGAQEALMLEEDGTVTEGGSSSVMIITADGTLVTRPMSQAILPGITRQSVKALCAEKNIPYEERLFSYEETLNAAEVVVASASSFVMPVVEIDGHRIGGGQPGPVARRLRELYIQHARATAV
ncbi:MAG: D-amino-acid transaminase [Beijerinckiaceae bacterium]